MRIINNDVLSIEGMLPFLSESKFADNIFIYSSLESTNSTAKEIVMSGAKHGTIVIADSQTAGRGRYGRSYFSPPGLGIYISFILHTSSKYLISNTPLLTIYAAVSVCEAIEKTTGIYPQIKWVNDILYNGNKICGILTEAVTDVKNDGFIYVIAGIGINFITPETGYPDDIKNIAGSLFSGTPPTITRNELTAELINRILNFEHRERKYKDKHRVSTETMHNETNRVDDSYISTMLNEYRKRLIVIGKRVIVTVFNESFNAIVIDIDATGRLIVQNDNGVVIPLSYGEVRIIQP